MNKENELERLKAASSKNWLLMGALLSMVLFLVYSIVLPIFSKKELGDWNIIITDLALFLIFGVISGLVVRISIKQKLKKYQG